MCFFQNWRVSGSVCVCLCPGKTDHYKVRHHVQLKILKKQCLRNFEPFMDNSNFIKFRYEKEKSFQILNFSPESKNVTFGFFEFKTSRDTTTMTFRRRLKQSTSSWNVVTKRMSLLTWERLPCQRATLTSNWRARNCLESTPMLTWPVWLLRMLSTKPIVNVSNTNNH